MGLGDNLIASGLARGAHARGKRIAFGDGRRIIWDHNSELIFRGNPNIAKPGSERDRDIEWIPFHKGSRIYNRHDVSGNRWAWNYDFRPVPGEIYITGDERIAGKRAGRGFVLIEPHVGDKIGVQNKDWGFGRYQHVADRLKKSGFRVCQFQYGKAGRALAGADQIGTSNFRDALAVLSHAALYIGPEGGLHHGAAAVGIPAVVIFGSWIPPQVTGYDTHTNIASGKACGSLASCPHCRAALDAITVEQVFEAARDRLT